MVINKSVNIIYTDNQLVVVNLKQDWADKKVKEIFRKLKITLGSKPMIEYNGEKIYGTEDDYICYFPMGEKYGEDNCQVIDYLISVVMENIVKEVQMVTIINLDKALESAYRELDMADDWKTAHEMLNVFKYEESLVVKCKNELPAEYEPVLVIGDGIAKTGQLIHGIFELDDNGYATVDGTEIINGDYTFQAIAWMPLSVFGVK